jgi:hypothetical protein
MTNKFSKKLRLMLASSMACLASFSWASDFSQPSLDDLDKAAQKIWTEQQLATNGDNNGEEYKSLCISLPNNPKPDFKSTTNQTPAWHIDFIYRQANDIELDKKLSKLNTLKEAGLLVKSTETVLSNGEKHTVYRYRLSDKGWGANINSRYPTCFVFGKVNYQKAISFERRSLPNHPELEIYNVTSTIGIRSPNEMPDWAQREDIQSEFPIIKENIAGKKFPVMLIKQNDEWVDASLTYMKAMFENSPEALAQIESDARKRETMAKEKKLSKKPTSDLPAATPDEIKAMLEEAYLLKSDQTNPSNCLSLPGDSSLPVDKNLSNYQTKKYSIEIFNNNDRNARDPILTKTIPYINQLDEIGVLKKTKSTEKNASNIYELTAKYADKIDAHYPYCFQLGRPTIEIVDLKIKDIYSGNFLTSSVQYKFRILNKNPPSWMTNDSKLKGWLELRGLLNFGRACEGSFTFDREKREMNGGSGTCIKSFDSLIDL